MPRKPTQRDGLCDALVQTLRITYSPCQQPLPLEHGPREGNLKAPAVLDNFCIETSKDKLYCSCWGQSVTQERTSAAAGGGPRREVRFDSDTSRVPRLITCTMLCRWHWQRQRDTPTSQCTLFSHFTSLGQCRFTLRPAVAVCNVLGLLCKRDFRPHTACVKPAAPNE